MIWNFINKKVKFSNISKDAFKTISNQKIYFNSLLIRKQ